MMAATQSFDDVGSAGRHGPESVEQMAKNRDDEEPGGSSYEQLTCQREAVSEIRQMGGACLSHAVCPRVQVFLYEPHNCEFISENAAWTQIGSSIYFHKARMCFHRPEKPDVWLRNDENILEYLTCNR